MNALDLRADHPELLREFTPPKRRVVTGIIDAIRRLGPDARLKPVGAP